MNPEHNIKSLWKELGDILSEHEDVTEPMYKLAELVFFTASKLSLTMMREAMDESSFVANAVLEFNDALCEQYLVQHDPLN
jgi:hypothetical protein